MSGYLIFGANTYKFQSLLRAILQCLLFLVTDNKEGFLAEIDPIMGVIYYLIFMVNFMN